MNTSVQSLPTFSGIYLFKDAAGTILYIGKAKSLRKRVATYFKRHQTDWKINALIEEHSHIDYIITDNEQQALLLEAQLISQHKPKYNVLLKEGQPYVYIQVSTDKTDKNQHGLPTLKLVRNKKERGTYFGPFLQKFQARSAYNYLMSTFKLKLCKAKIENGCLDYHIGICAGNCKAAFDTKDYLFRLSLATDVLKKDHRGFLAKLKEKIAEYNQEMAFEKSQRLHEYAENFDSIFTTLKAKFSPRKFENAVVAATGPKLYVAQFGTSLANELQQFLHVPAPVSTIDCFDISHFQSKGLVGSCIRFKDGKPDKNNFRRFNIKSITTQDDYAALQEIVSRRYKNPENLPDLVVIDGGKGQLNAARVVLPAHIPCISLAKKEETIFSEQFPHGIRIDTSTEVGKLLIALRDYTHHFAISFHRIKRLKSVEENQ